MQRSLKGRFLCEAFFDKGGILKLDIKFENTITPKEYNDLREKIGWKPHDLKRVEEAIKSSRFVRKVVINGEIIGMARVICDGIYAFVVDVIVSPNYQNMGIGKKLMQELLDEIEKSINEGETMSVNLVSMAGKEEFYEKCGFRKIPYEYTGYGMKKVIKK